MGIDGTYKLTRTESSREALVSPAMFPDLEFDPWLSEQLSRPTYRLARRLKRPPRVNGSPLDLDSALTDRLDGPVFIYAKVDTSNLKEVRRLTRLGFDLIETSVILERPPGPAEALIGRAEIRPARPEDEEEVAETARRGFKYSRFHVDPAIGPELGNQIKEAWVRNFFRGRRGQAMFIASYGGRVAGFLLLLHEAQGLVIDLIAVRPEARGLGLARDMIAFSLNNHEELKMMRVGTQIQNVESLGLYGRLGFKLAGSQHVFHYHR